MYKYIALLIIFFIVCYVGYLIKKTYKTKLDFLISYKKFLEYVLFEIKNSKTEFIKIVSNYIINNKNIFSNILEKYNNDIYNNYDLVLPKYLFLSNEETSFIKMFFKNIANYDYINTIKFIEKNIFEIDNFIEKAKNELTKKGDLYYKLSIMLAFFIVIILI